MKTRDLLLVVSLVAIAGTFTSIAQIFSVNAVGYVNVTVGANSYCILANPLVHCSNRELVSIIFGRAVGAQKGHL